MKSVFNILIASVLSASLLSAGTPAALLAHYCGSELMGIGAVEDAAVLTGCCSSPVKEHTSDHKDMDCAEPGCCSFETVVFPGMDETTPASRVECSHFIAIAPMARMDTPYIAPKNDPATFIREPGFATPQRGGWAWRIAIQSFQL